MRVPMHEYAHLLHRVKWLNRLPLSWALFVCVHMARWHRDVRMDHDGHMSWQSTYVALVLSGFR